MPLTYRTAGESHGPALFAVVEGLPSGLPLVPDDIDADLARRQLGYGRGGRMKIETDRVQVKSGLRHGRTIGSPLTLEITNLDFPKWAEDRMAIWEPHDEVEPITLPRPGHADLAGMLKYGTDDLRPILERASARETAARVAAGGVAKAHPAPLRHRDPQPRGAHRRPRRCRSATTSSSATSRGWTRARCDVSTRRRPSG